MLSRFPTQGGGDSSSFPSSATEAEQFVSDFQSLMEQLKRENDDLQLKLQAEEAQTNSLKSELEQAQTEISQLESTSKEIQAQKALLESEIEKTGLDVTGLKAKITGFDFKIQESSKVLKSVEESSTKVGDEYLQKLLKLDQKTRLARDLAVSVPLDSECCQELEQKRNELKRKVSELGQL